MQNFVYNADEVLSQSNADLKKRVKTRCISTPDLGIYQA